MRRLLVCLCLLVSTANAGTVAMLPLDTEKRLEIYSQPFAAEIARALKAAGLDVVVVGAKMEVPDSAQLIVDGSIKAGKGKEVTVAIRIRDSRDGTVLESVPPATTALANIDKAAAELSARVVPLVQAHLAELTKATEADKQVEPVPPPAAGPTLPVVVTAVFASKRVGELHRPDLIPKFTLLRDAIGAALPRWALDDKHQAKNVPVEWLAPGKAMATVLAQHADAGITFEVLAFYIERPDGIPQARARVHVRITGYDGIKFDRIVHTDTVVGDKGMADDALAARTAREVLAIVKPNIRRALVTWRR